MKIIFKFIFFITLFLFLNIKSYDTENYIALDNEKDLHSQDFFSIKLENFNIYDLKILEDYDIDILSIIPKENIFNVEKIKFKSKNINNIINESIKDYKDKLISNSYNEEAIFIENKGFIISKIKFISSQEEVIKLEKEINFKILST